MKLTLLGKNIALVLSVSNISVNIKVASIRYKLKKNCQTEQLQKKKQRNKLQDSIKVFFDFVHPLYFVYLTVAHDYFLISFRNEASPWCLN